MQIGVGLDPTLGLNWEQQREVSKEAARLGYTSIWTPEGTGRTRSTYAYSAGRRPPKLSLRD